MVAVKNILLVCFVLTFTFGCIKFTVTPIVATVPLVPSEIAKSRVLGKSCGSGYVFSGSGNLSLKDLLEKNKASKITLVDYDASFNMFGGEVCMTVYGY